MACVFRSFFERVTHDRFDLRRHLCRATTNVGGPGRCFFRCRNRVRFERPSRRALLSITRLYTSARASGG